MTENNGTGGVRVTTKDIFEEVQRQGRLLDKIANSLPDTETQVSDHEQRIRRLEMRMGWIFGALGLMGALVGVFSVSLTP
jgi:dissimilatory sulfite reductase (desulfoviridin) alpha/beta subunit